MEVFQLTLEIDFVPYMVHLHYIGYYELPVLMPLCSVKNSSEII